MDKSLGEKLAQIADNARDQAFLKYSIDLNYTPGCFSKLESILQIEKEIYQRDVSEGYDLEKKCRLWGIFLGEIFRQDIGGYWHIYKDKPMISVFGYRINPCDFVRNKIQNQTNIDLVDYYSEKIKALRENHTETSSYTIIANDTNTSEENKTYKFREINEIGSKNKNENIFIITIAILAVIITSVFLISKLQSEITSPKVTPLSELPATWTPISATPTKVNTTTPTIQIIKNIDLEKIVPHISEMPDGFAIHAIEGPKELDYGGNSYIVGFVNYGWGLGEITTYHYMIKELLSEEEAITEFRANYEGFKEGVQEAEYNGAREYGSEYKYVDGQWLIYWVTGNEFWAMASARIDNILIYVTYSIMHFDKLENIDPAVAGLEYLNWAIENVGDELGKQ